MSDRFNSAITIDRDTQLPARRQSDQIRALSLARLQLLVAPRQPDASRHNHPGGDALML